MSVLVFPEALPDVGAGRGPAVVQVSFSLAAATVTAVSGGGQTRAALVGAPPLWAGSVQTGLLVGAGLRRWRAWLARQGEGVGSFFAPDLSRRRPAAYPHGVAHLERAAGGAFDGSLTWSLDATGTVLNLSGAPAGYVWSDGDLLGFRWDGPRRAVVEVQAPAGTVTANEAGAASLAVRPVLYNPPPVHAALSVLDAEVTARVEPGSVDPASVSRGERGTVAFRFVQTSL